MRQVGKIERNTIESWFLFIDSVNGYGKTVSFIAYESEDGIDIYYLKKNFTNIRGRVIFFVVDEKAYVRELRPNKRTEFK